ncbi:unnamed protein product [Effrenium voratum]|nr:unnamed protein product [Effrenium voratum]
MISFYDWAPTTSGGPQRQEDDLAAQESCETQQAICQKIQDAVDISDVFNKVAIHAGKASPKTLVYAAHRIARYCRLRRQDIGPTRRARRFLALLESLQCKVAAMDAQALTDLSWALAVLNHKDNKLLAGLCHQLFGRMEDLSPANLAICAWSFATLHYRDDLLMKRLNRQALGRDFEAQSLANLCWAEATMRFKDDVLMHHLSHEALRKMNSFSPQHLANTAWAFATLGRRAEVLFRALEQRALELLEFEKELKEDFVPLDLALCAWSFAWLEHAGPDSLLLRKIAQAALRRLEEFSTQQLANMLWGLDHANYVDPAFFRAVASWCCARPMRFWHKAAGEELVSIMTALRPYAEGGQAWGELEAFFTNETLRPLAQFLCASNSSEGYVQGLRQLRTYHAGALYTSWLLQELGIAFLGHGDARVAQKVEDLTNFYLLPPEPRWLPDGYDDDDVQANRAEIPSLLELLEVKRRVQPSSHFIALHLSAELVAGGLRRNIWRVVPTRPPRRSGLCFVRGEKLEEHGDDDDKMAGMRTATLRDYQRKHHAEVTALSQVAEAISEIREAAFERESEVSGWVELFVPHYPCSSCTGALVQFASCHPKITLRVGHEDWRHWLRRLDVRWDKADPRHQALSINARQLRDLDQTAPDATAIPENYRAALRRTLGSTGIGEREEVKKQTFY